MRIATGSQTINEGKPRKTVDKTEEFHCYKCDRLIDEKKACPLFENLHTEQGQAACEQEKLR